MTSNNQPQTSNRTIIAFPVEQQLKTITVLILIVFNVILVSTSSNIEVFCNVPRCLWDFNDYWQIPNNIISARAHLRLIVETNLIKRQQSFQHNNGCNTNKHLRTIGKAQCFRYTSRGSGQSRQCITCSQRRETLGLQCPISGRHRICFTL